MLRGPPVGHCQRTSRIGGLPDEHLHDLRRLRSGHHMAAPLDDARFLDGDFRQGLPQEAHVVSADRRQYGHTGIFHYISRI